MVVQETEVVCRPNTDPFDLNLEWQMRAEKELNECPETARKNVVQLRQKLKGKSYNIVHNYRLKDLTFHTI